MNVAFIKTNRENIFVIVDKEDEAFILQHNVKWSFSNSGYAGAKSKVLHKPVFIHKLLMPEPGKVVDHIDRNKLNCCRANLRYVTKSQSIQNSKPSLGQSKYKGLKRSRHKWQVRISVNNKRINLGNFYDEKEGALAYDKAARLYFGEHAALNFPDIKN